VKEKMASITSPAEQDVTKELSVLQKALDTKRKELADSFQLIGKSESKMHAAVAELDNVKAENVALLLDLDEERRKVTTARKENLQLQIDLQRLQKEKDEAVQESQARIKELITTNEQLDELLSSAEQSSLNIKERLQDSEGGLRIPSSDIKLTDMKLGHGSYGGCLNLFANMDVYILHLVINSFPCVEVCIAYWQGCPVAVKMLYEVLASSPHNIDLLKQEVSVTWKLHHPNVAGVCGITLELDDKTKNAWIVMELLQGSMAGVIDESRREGVKPLSLREKVDMAYDSLCGLNYLQHLNPAVLHGDIRPTNILITTVMQAKLGDLGAARFSDASLSVGLVSPQYAATERLDGRSASKSKETDVYSMGVTLCELFTGIPPNREERLDQVQDIRERNIRYLCKLMVSDDPEKRPSTEQALAGIGGIRKTSEYKACGPRRMVKGRLDGVENVRFADSMW
jgi:serine/threonine protein kinase